jgi:hypothetical protein
MTKSIVINYSAGLERHSVDDSYFEGKFSW